jgi:hypothetical protein
LNKENYIFTPVIQQGEGRKGRDFKGSFADRGESTVIDNTKIKE